MKYFFTISTMLIIHFSLLHSDRNVIDKAVSVNHALVIAKQAMHIDLDSKKMQEYADSYFEHSGKTLDTVMFAEILSNAGTVDTSEWKDEEVRNAVLVQKREEQISKTYMIEKLKLSGKKQMRYYTRYVNRYNETNSADRTIYYFSKPVYSNSGKFALIQWHNEHSGLTEREGMDLYYLEGNEWTKAGVITVDRK